MKVKTPHCRSYKSNHPLDPEEWGCDEEECIESGECKYIDRDHLKKLVYQYTNKVSGLSLVHDPYLEELIDKILESK